MRKVLLFLSLCLFSAQSSSQMMTGDVGMKQIHGDWVSFLLNIGDNTEPRASSPSFEDFGPIVIDFARPECTAHLGFVIPLGLTATADSLREDITLSLRADKKMRYDLPAVSSVTMGDSYAYVLLNATPQFGFILEDMRTGLSLRTKLKIGNDEENASYATYSLRGFTAAYNRAYALCTKASGNNQPPNYIDRL